MRWILTVAVLLGASSIIIGAALRHSGGDMDMEVLQTALRYHQFHSVLLVALGLYALDKAPSIRLVIPAVLFAFGIFVFSGSLYCMEIFKVSALGKLTPVGGIILILSWFSVVFIKPFTANGKGA